MNVGSLSDDYSDHQQWCSRVVNQTNLGLASSVDISSRHGQKENSNVELWKWNSSVNLRYCAGEALFVNVILKDVVRMINCPVRHA